MFLAIILIAVGVAILLNTLGLFNGSFWGIFWAIFFVALGIKVMMRKGKCPICGWHYWEGKMHDKMHGYCCGGHNHHDHESEEQDQK